MNTRIKVLIVLVLFTIMGVGPVPVTSVIDIYIALFRPAWFKELVLKLYGEEKR